MSLSSIVLGALAVTLAFGGAYTIGSATGERSFAQARPAETITVSRDIPLIPSVAPHGALPDLAQRPARDRRVKRKTVPAAKPRGAAPKRPAPALRVPRPTRPQPRRRPSAPRPDRPDSSSEPPTYQPPPPRVTPVPTQVAPVPLEPDPEDEEEVPDEETAPE